MSRFLEGARKISVAVLLFGHSLRFFGRPLLVWWQVSNVLKRIENAAIAGDLRDRAGNQLAARNWIIHHLPLGKPDYDPISFQKELIATIVSGIVRAMVGQTRIANIRFVNLYVESQASRLVIQDKISRIMKRRVGNREIPAKANVRKIPHQATVKSPLARSLLSSAFSR